MADGEIKETGPVLAGVSLVAAPPVGHLHFPIARGLTVLYGPNGSGKSSILRAIETCIHGATQTDDPAHLGNRGEPASAFDAAYRIGGAHIVAPVTEERLHPGRHWLPGVIRDNLQFWEHIADTDDRTVLPQVTDWARGHLPWQDPTEEDAKYLLRHGRWMICPTDPSQVFLCDPDPYRGPLTERWDRSDSDWSEHLSEANDASGERERGSDVIWSRWRDLAGEHVEVSFPVGSPRTFMRSAPPLPPRPEVLGLPRWPDWAGLPVVAFGLGQSLSIPPQVSDVSAFDPPIVEHADESLDVLTSRRLAEMADRSQRWDDDKTSRRLADFEQRANALLADLFENPPVLSAITTDRAGVFAGRPPISWGVSINGTDGVAMDRLGTAHQRFVSFAIQRATAPTEVETTWVPRLGSSSPKWPRISTAIIDEPDRALHPVAQSFLAPRLADLADHVIVAAHSANVLAHADTQHIVTVDDYGFSQLSKPDPTQFGPIAERATALGMSPADLLTAASTILLVEGPHDVIVIGSFLRPELEETITLTFALGGTDGLESVAAATLLFEATAVPIVVCLDHLHHSVSEDLRELQTCPRPDRWSKIESLRNKPEYRKKREMEALLALFNAAIEANRLDRLRVHPFTKPDIGHYIDPDLVSGRPDTSWDQLTDEFLSSRTPPQKNMKRDDGKAFKKFVGTGYTIPGLQRAVNQQTQRWETDLGTAAHRHDDFNRLANLLSETAANRDRG